MKWAGKGREIVHPVTFPYSLDNFFFIVNFISEFYSFLSAQYWQCRGSFNLE